MDTCQNCKFFLSENTDAGLCRRFPPLVIVYVNGPIASVFPHMQNVGYCGEHKGIES